MERTRLWLLLIGIFVLKRDNEDLGLCVYSKQSTASILPEAGHVVRLNIQKRRTDVLEDVAKLMMTSSPCASSSGRGIAFSAAPLLIRTFEYQYPSAGSNF
jgi:hypothetical protein